jgi:hypothetical protein
MNLSCTLVKLSDFERLDALNLRLPKSLGTSVS